MKKQNTTKFISDSEMEEILNDKNLLNALRKGKEEIKKGKYKIVKYF